MLKKSVTTLLDEAQLEIDGALAVEEKVEDKVEEEEVVEVKQEEEVVVEEKVEVEVKKPEEPIGTKEKEEVTAVIEE